eukprot:767365-Pleurochrysis_carterae.AAC.1
MARYAGYQHIRSLSYNLQSNCLEERGVKRIFDLLVHHTHHVRVWHLTLLMTTFAINTTVDSSTGRTPFFALAGQHP